MKKKMSRGHVLYILKFSFYFRAVSTMYEEKNVSIIFFIIIEFPSCSVFAIVDPFVFGLWA